ncbi:MAG: tRNA (N(6)-L-threonylcarbamoyladenosine(37)-C(2))-methylthiotransferase [Thaumarchaeota archaeon]|nr:tRNA (N(6)-L-threonylcarbamoyladenosine(37)-C(2))-methylthiotransferase [Nitrososphaerota archaeon]
MASNKVYIEAYGCSASLADSEMIMGLLNQAGYQIVDSQAPSDLNIIVTCTVKTPTFHKMSHRIKQLYSEGKPLIIAGCMPKTEKQTLEKIAPNASLLGPSNLDKAVESVTATLEDRRVTFTSNSRQEKVLLPRLRRNPVVEMVEIGSGCISACTFCQVKLAKGGLVSYRPGAIIREVEDAVKQDCKEIWLTSTDNGCYGKDIHTDLAELIELVCGVEGDFRVRVGMMNPMHLPRFLPRLIEAYRHEKVFKFLHIPVQSGSDKILEDMARGHTVEEFKEIVDEFRRVIPEITLSTDIIVGFPTENEEDFQATVHLLEEVKPDVVNLSKYGARQGTKAAMMSQINGGIVKDRSTMIHGLVRKISLESNKRWMSWRGEVLVDEHREGDSVGRNFAYKPVALRSNIPLGSTVEVEVSGASTACLLGRVL